MCHILSSDEELDDFADNYLEVWVNELPDLLLVNEFADMTLVDEISGYVSSTDCGDKSTLHYFSVWMRVF